MIGDVPEGVPALGTGSWLFLAGVAVAALGGAAFGLVMLPDRAWEWPALQLHGPDLRAALDWRYADEVLILLYVAMVDVVALGFTLVMFYSPLAMAVPASACAVALACIGYNITKHAA